MYLKWGGSFPRSHRGFAQNEDAWVGNTHLTGSLLHTTWEKHRVSGFCQDLHKTRWWFQTFFIFTPNFGENEPILTLIFFRWVGSTTIFTKRSWKPRNFPIPRPTTGSTISTLLHDKINPKDFQVLSLGDTGFLQFFRVVSRDYGKPRTIIRSFGLWKMKSSSFPSTSVNKIYLSFEGVNTPLFVKKKLAGVHKWSPKSLWRNENLKLVEWFLNFVFVSLFIFFFLGFFFLVNPSNLGGNNPLNMFVFSKTS